MAYFVKEMGPVGVLFWAVVGFYKIVFYILRFLFRGLASGRAKGLDFPLQARFEHTHIVGGSGWGKTQLLQNLFAHLDLEALMDGKRSVVIMDSQGDMLKTILSLNHLTPGTPLADRLIYIDPNDIEHPPCLNLFDFGLDRLKDYDPVEREKILNGAISIYEYMFGALLGAELTNRQGVIFRYLARLLMEVPHPTIYTSWTLWRSQNLSVPI